MTKRVTRTLPRLALLAAAAVLCLATGSWREEPNNHRTDETWVVQNLWDGQTSVDPGLAIVLTVGQRDFEFNSQGRELIGQARIRHADGGAVLPADIDVQWSRTIIRARGGLPAGGDFLLDLEPLRGTFFADRQLPPATLRFSTRTGPRVVSLWSNEQTLFIVFSEPMDPSSLDVGPGGVDVLWDEGGELKSLSSSLNLAGFAWRTDGAIFKLAPFDFTGEVYLLVAAGVTSAQGVALDSDEDGIPGGPLDDFVTKVRASALETCYARDDIPQPCTRLGDIPDFGGWW